MRFHVDIHNKYTPRAYRAELRRVDYAKINAAISDMKHRARAFKLGQSLICTSGGKTMTIMIMQCRLGEYDGKHSVRACLKISELIFIKKSFVRKTSTKRKNQKTSHVSDQLTKSLKTTGAWMWTTEMADTEYMVIKDVDDNPVSIPINKKRSRMVLARVKRKKARRKKWPKKITRRKSQDSD